MFWWDIPKTYAKLNRQLTKEDVGNTKLKMISLVLILYKTVLILILFQNHLRIDSLRLHLIKIFRERVIKTKHKTCFDYLLTVFPINTIY